MKNIGIPAMAAQTAIITGRVQGVGFRWQASDVANRLRLSGWIRNTADGSVETWCEGPPEALERFAAWLRQGPPGARVDEVKLRAVAPTGVYRRFSVEY